MKCEDVMVFFEDDPDRPLDGAVGSLVRAHVEDCPACAEAHESMMALRDQVASLPRSVEPTRELWPQIEARITATKVARPRFGWRAFVAAAAAVLMISSVIAAYVVGRQQATSVAVVAPVSRSVSTEVLAVSFAGIGVHDYQVTRQQLLDVLEARRSELSPATLEVVLNNLRLIDEAMGEIATAMGEDPGNELLMRQLVMTYRQQVNLLERAAILPREI